MSSGYDNVMDDIAAPHTLYVSRIVDVPALTAAAAFDAVVPHARPTPYAIRTARSRLALTRWIGIAVEVELVMWSTRSCEVGLRPDRRVIPFSGGWRHRRYVRSAELEIDRLAAAIATTVAGWFVAAWTDAPTPSRSAA